MCFLFKPLEAVLSFCMCFALALLCSCHTYIPHNPLPAWRELFRRRWGHQDFSTIFLGSHILEASGSDKEPSIAD